VHWDGSVPADSAATLNPLVPGRRNFFFFVNFELKFAGKMHPETKPPRAETNFLMQALSSFCYLSKT
jgi:hypothetical protein